MARNSHGWPTQSLKPTGFPPLRRLQLGDETHHARAASKRRRGAPAKGNRCPLGTPRMAAISAVTFAAGSTPPWPGFGALAELDLDHLDLIVGGRGGEAVGIERAVGGAATEIARADFPDHVAAALAVIGAEAAFAGVVGEAAERRAAIEGANGVGAQRAEAHRRDVEHGRRIGLGAARAADQNSERRRSDLGRRDRMAQPLVALGVDVELRAERPLVELHLGALIDDGALIARERQAVGLALEEILPHLRPHLFEQKAQVGGDRIIAQNRVGGLNEVAETEQRKCAKYHDRREEQRPPVRRRADRRGGKGERQQHARRQDDETRRKRQSQDSQATPPSIRLPCALRRRSLRRSRETADHAGIFSRDHEDSATPAAGPLAPAAR